MASAANATTPGGFWKRLKLLLPSSGQDISDETCITDDGVVVNEPSNLFNEYFSTPTLSQAMCRVFTFPLASFLLTYFIGIIFLMPCRSK